MNSPPRPRFAPRPGDTTGPLLSSLSTLFPAAAAVAVALSAPDLAAAVPVLLPLAAVRATDGAPVLENGTRRAVYDLVREHPGATIRRAAEAADVSHSTATYHLETLAEAGLVASIEDGNKRRFFPNAGAYTEDERRLLAVLESETTRAILGAIAEAEPATQADVAEAVGVSPPTVSWHLDRLDACQVVRRDSTRGLDLDRDRLADLLEPLVEKLDDVGYESKPLEDLAETVLD